MPIEDRAGIDFSYNFDYRFIDRLSVGALVGFSKNGNPKFSSIKTGLGIKYYYPRNKDYYFNIHYGYQIPFDNEKFREGHQIRLGQYFDVGKIVDKKVLLGVYYEYDFYYLDGAKPLINTEIPSSLLYRSWGLSLGIKL
jgi:hypothetical protein